MPAASGSVTTPIAVAATSQRSQTSCTAASDSGVTIASIRSWLSLVITSTGLMFGSRRGTRETSTSMPRRACAAVSLVAHDRPAPPRSWMPTTRPASRSSRQASISRFSSYGSEIWMLGRFVDWPAASASAKPAEASTLTPPIPSRPVAEPSSTARFPTPDAEESTRREIGSTPRQKTLTSGFDR